MKRHRRDLEVMSDLNLTNMIDTAFVLLIVFILVAPAMKSGLIIDLPKVAGTEAKPTDANKVLTISVQYQKDNPGFPDQIIVDQRRLTIDELRALVASKLATSKKLDVAIEADGQAKYDLIAQVLGVLKQQNVESVDLVTDPADSTPPSALPNKAAIRKPGT